MPLIQPICSYFYFKGLNQPKWLKLTSQSKTIPIKFVVILTISVVLTLEKLN